MFVNITPGFRIRFDVDRWMKPGLASIIIQDNTKTLNRFATALVFSNISPVLKRWLVRMIKTIVDFSESKLLATDWTVINDCSCPYFPKQSSPRYLICLQKLVKTPMIKSTINLMLSYFLTKCINQNCVLLRVLASLPLLLFFSEQMRTVKTSIKSILILVYHVLKFVHKQFWKKTVSLIFKIV